MSSPLPRAPLIALALSGCLSGWGDRTATSPQAGRAAGWTSESHGGLSVQLYTPAADGVVGDGRALLIALHGCAQTANDLRTYGNWDDSAEEFGVVVALPSVPGGGVYAGCWNYYGSSHSRGAGDARYLLKLVDSLLSDETLGIDPDQVYIAGLSSGGGMTMVMGCLAPDVFAGVGIAAGPTVGTTARQIFSVSTTAAAAQSACETLAGSAKADFDTQLASVIYGTADYTVSTGYGTLNAVVFAEIYGDTAGAALTTTSLDVAALHGTSPSGTGTLYLDAEGARVSRIAASGMGHAWPAGSGTGSERSYVAQKGVDYAWYLAEFFSENNRRVARDAAPEDTGGEDPGDEDTGGSSGGSSGSGSSSGGSSGSSGSGGSSSGGSGGSSSSSSSGGGSGSSSSSSGGSSGGSGSSSGASSSSSSGADTGSGDTGGADTGSSDCPPWVETATDTIIGHFSRFETYDHGYGVADATYVELMLTYGTTRKFTLYLGTDGHWYLDPENVPGAEDC